MLAEFPAPADCDSEDMNLRTAPAPVIGALLEACSEGVLHLSSDGQILEANDAVAEILGVARIDLYGDRLDTGPWRLVGVATPAAAARARSLTAELISGPAVMNLGAEVHRPDSTRRSVVIASIPVAGEPGQPASRLVTMTESSTQRASEEDARRTSDQEAISIYAGAIANDFNNILTAVLGNISLAKLDVPQDEEIYRTLTYVERAVVRAQELVRKLFTLPQPGKFTEERIAFEFLVDEAISLASRATRLAIDKTLPGSGWLVEATYPNLAQAIRNLILHLAEEARTEEAPSGGRVFVHAEALRVAHGDLCQLAEGSYARITISRDPAAPDTRQFQFRANMTGMGPTLAAADLIIRENRGVIAMADHAFQVYLPALMPAGEPPVEVEEAPIHGAGRILVMDDQEMVRSVAGRMLNHLGYEVDFATDGARAIEMYRRATGEGRPFAAVILDLDVPGGMGGRETIERLRAIHAEVKGIVSTGHMTDPVGADFKAYGFSATVQKPYEIRSLSRTLHQILKAGR